MLILILRRLPHHGRPIKVLDFTNLSGAFGTIGDTGASLIGSGGTGAKDGFMAGFNLIPAVMFFCGLLAVFEQLGAYKASEILFRPTAAPPAGHPRPVRHRFHLQLYRLRRGRGYDPRPL